MLAELEQRGWNVATCDLEDGDCCRKTFLNSVDIRYDLVVHCAYHVGGRAAIDGKPRNLAWNLELDAQMFDWAVQTRQRAVMYLSSSAAYPVAYQSEHPSGMAVYLHGPNAWSFQDGKSWISLSEDMIDLEDVRQPDANYGWAKLTGEILAKAATESGLRVHVVRPFSGYGGDQDLDYPFPAIAKRVIGGDLTVWGPPGQIRDWIHIDDVIAGALAVYDADYRDPVNLCSGVPVEFGELVTRIAKEIGVSVDPARIGYQRHRPTGVFCRVGDPTRMLDLYTPTVSLEEGIRRVLSEVATSR